MAPKSQLSGDVNRISACGVLLRKYLYLQNPIWEPCLVSGYGRRTVLSFLTRVPKITLNLPGQVTMVLASAADIPKKPGLKWASKVSPSGRL